MNSSLNQNEPTTRLILGRGGIMKHKPSKKMFNSFKCLILSFFATITLNLTPSLALSEELLDFNSVVEEGRGSDGIDIRSDMTIVNYKSGDWFCIDLKSSLGEDAKMRIKLKKKESGGGYVKVTRLTPDGTTLGRIDTSNISQSSYEWTNEETLGKTSQQVLCFVLSGARIQIEEIGLTRSGGGSDTSGGSSGQSVSFGNIVSQGSGSDGIDVRSDGVIVNYKANDWFCVDIGDSLGNDASMRIKLKRKESGSGYVKVTRLTHDGNTLGKIDTSNISRSSYEWTDTVKLNGTSQKVLCFVLRGAKIQIEDIDILYNHKGSEDESPNDGEGDGNVTIDFDISQDDGDVGVVVKPRENIGGAGTNIALYIRKSGGSFSHIRTEGAAPYEWGEENDNFNDSKLLDLDGEYILKANIIEGPYKGKVATKRFRVDGSTDGSFNNGGSSDADDGNGSSNFQMKLNGKWQPICCEGGKPTISDRGCQWKESGRVLIDKTANKEFQCKEYHNRQGSAWNRLKEPYPKDCTCVNSGGERMHGAPGPNVIDSLEHRVNGEHVGAPIFPNIGRERCIKVKSNGDLKSQRSDVRGDKWSDNSGWPDKDCPHFRIRGNY
jgi:hypothetical protein